MSEGTKYRIAMVAACPFPANYGSPASIREMSISLAESGHKVFILTYPYGQDMKVAPAVLQRVGGSNESAITVGPTWKKPLIDLKMVIELVRLIRREKIQVIHAHNYEGALIGILGKWLTGTPLLYNAVNTMKDELAGYNFIKPKFIAQWLAGLLDWFTPKPANYITAVSEQLRDDLIQRGKDPKIVKYVPAGVHPELFDGANGQRFREVYQLGDTPVIMYTGTLDAFQRIDNLFHAFKHVLQLRPDAKLMMVIPITDPKGIAREQEKIMQLGIAGEQVIWAGPHPLDDLKDYLATANVAVVPRPDCPGHPVKLLNYMTCACPIVCFAGSAKGVSHGVSALVVADNDCQALGESMVQLINDDELAKRLGAGARKSLLQNFTWDSICTHYEQAYAYMLAGQPATHET
ncbi:MAG: 1,2-diacylglycerol 3-alpha-glucosyltransferase [Lentimonas sp.]|jgi:1,2-diacylglycerol 3-alpha-glucosyltransferase